MPPHDNSEREEIRRILKKINDAWVKGPSEDLAEYFHEDMVIAGPGLEESGKGRPACTASYEEFTRVAAIKDFEESELNIHIWNDTAVAHYKFTIAYEMEGRDHLDSGCDLFVFNKSEGKWIAVWRTILPGNRD